MAQKSYDPYEQWKRMDNYLKSFLLEHQLDEENRSKIKHFHYQYLMKAANLDWKEAEAFERDISPWRPATRGDYHRFYRPNNVLLKAIEKEMADAIQFKEGTVLLLNDQELEEELQKHASEIAGQKFLLLPDHVEKDKVLEMIVNKGYTPSLQEAAHTAAKLDLYHPNLSYEFPRKERGSLTFRGFIQNPLFNGFKRFAEHSFPASIVVDLIEGFYSVALDAIFKRKKMSALLEDSLGRVLHYFDRAMKHSSTSYVDLQKFENDLELIYEEMIFWLLIAEPYFPNELENMIQKIIPKPQFFKMTQSGMAAFSEIVRVLIQPNSEILYYDDCYFENVEALKKGKAVRYPDYDRSLEEQLGKQIDLLFVDFHTNLVAGKMENKGHDVQAILAKVLPFASKKFSLVIDNTIGYLKSIEIEELLKANPKVNIIVFWSLQKFDMFGTDKFTAGAYAVYSRDEKLLAQFQKIQGGDIDSLTRQGLSHFFTFGSPKLEERRRRIFDNAKYVNEQLDPKIQTVVKKKDSVIFSVDLHLPWDKEEEIGILKQFEAKGVPLMTRPSFGYNLTTSTFIREQKMMRFSIGLEDRLFLDQFIAAFNSIFSIEKVASQGVGVTVDKKAN